MKLPSWVGRAAQAVVAADAVILAALVHENVISSLLATDIGGVIAALAVGWHGANVAATVKARQAEIAPAPTTSTTPA